MRVEQAPPLQRDLHRLDVILRHHDYVRPRVLVLRRGLALDGERQGVRDPQRLHRKDLPWCCPRETLISCTTISLTMSKTSACVLGLFLTASTLQPASRAPVRGSQGMVVSVSPLASQIGVDILKKGGNAADAAVAVGFALAVTWPTAGNWRGRVHDPA